jgi:hypothetical protein
MLILHVRLTEGKKIRAWYSNFSPFGITYVGKYPLDLVIVFEDGTIEMFQIDGHFIHGHAGSDCPTLKSYKNDMTRQQVEEETLLRDGAINDWISETDPSKIKYFVMKDCCTPEFNTWSLNGYFKTIPVLANLVRPYQTIDGMLDENNETTTFIAVVRGSVPLHKRLEAPIFGPLVVWTEFGQELVWEGRLVLTKDYFIYLRKEFDFQIENIEWAVFYPRCFVFNQIYKHLLNLRETSKPSIASLIKVIVNHSAGYFGLNSGKRQPTKCRISSKIQLNPGHNEFNALGSIQENNYFYIKTFGIQKDHVVACHTPLFMFLAIVEMGKMRLNKIMLFLHRKLQPGSFRIFYINTDSTVLALATPTLEDAVDPRQLDEFRNGWDNDLASGKPGCMKLEFIVPQHSNWEMASHDLRNYAIKCDLPEYNRHKMSALNNLTPERAFAISHQHINQQPVVIEQVRRTDKLVNLLTETKQICFNPRKKIKLDHA